MDTARRVRQTTGGGALGSLGLAAAGSALALAISAYAVAHPSESALLAGVIALVSGTAALALARPRAFVALAIPLFAAIPMAKVVVTPGVGPVKDVVIISAAASLALAKALRLPMVGKGKPVDPVLAVIAVVLIAIYLIDPGGSHGAGWAAQTRLVTEPFLLFFIGWVLAARDGVSTTFRTTLLWTAGVVAAYGLLQQVIGASRLASWGYSYDAQLRTVAGRLRSFGTLDSSFEYVTLLSLAIAVALLWRGRRPPLALVALLVAGLAVGFVRTSAVIALALIALVVILRGRPFVGIALLAAGLVAGVTLLGLGPTASAPRADQLAAERSVTLNGRVGVWSAVIDSPRDFAIGRGVGVVGTGAERALIQQESGSGLTTVTSGDRSGAGSGLAVDSAYFAAIADVGILGVLAIVAFFLRSAALARAVEQRAVVWGFLLVIVIDGITRSSLTAFPSVFVAFLGLGILLGTRTQAEQPGTSAARSDGPVALIRL